MSVDPTHAHDEVQSLADSANNQLSLADAANQKLKDENARLQAELDAMKPQPKGCQFGVLSNGSVSGQFKDLHSAIQIVRCYTGTITDWAQEPQHKAIAGVGLYAPSNTVQLSPTGLDQLLASIPDDEKKKILGWCDTHEPENPQKGLDPATYRARRRTTNQIIRDHGLKSVSCLMGWTVDPDSKRDWKSWVDLETTDILCWDTYNAGAKKNPPVYQNIDKMFQDMLNASSATGLPWGMWETGTTNFGTVSARVDWIKKLRQGAIDHNAVCAIYFDRKGVSDPNWDASLDHDTASAWLGV